MFLKYSKKQALEDLDGTLKLIAESFDDLKWPEAAAAEKTDDKKEEEKKEEEKEGGDSDFAANVTKAFYTHPFFADQIKSYIMQTELQPAFNILDPTAGAMKFDWTFGMMGKPIDFAFVATLIFLYVDRQEADGEDKEVWFTAKLTDADKEELEEVFAAKDKKAVVFPGVIQVYGA